MAYFCNVVDSTSSLMYLIRQSISLLDCRVTNFPPVPRQITFHWFQLVRLVSLASYTSYVWCFVAEEWG